MSGAERLPGTVVPGRSPLGDDWPFVPQTPSPASSVTDEREGWQRPTGTAFTAETPSFAKASEGRLRAQRRWDGRTKSPEATEGPAERVSETARLPRGSDGVDAPRNDSKRGRANDNDEIATPRLRRGSQ